EQGMSIPPPLAAPAEEALAKLENENLRITFHRAGDRTGIRIATRGPSGWEALSEDAGAASWTVVGRSAGKVPTIRKGHIYPDWDATESPLLEVGVGNAKVRTRRSNVSTAPWESGKCVALRPASARQVDARTVELEFPPSALGRLV